MTDIHLSLRETALVTDRLLLLAGVPSGAVTAFRDLVLAGAVTGVPTLAALDPEGPLADRLRWQPPECTRTGAEVEVSGRGALSLFAVVPALDLAAALAADHAEVGLRVVDVAAPELLAAARPFAPDLGVRVRPGDDTARFTLVRDSAPGRWRSGLVRAGLRLDAALWWRLYHRSNDALTEDTALSRTHAGATIAPSSHSDASLVPGADQDVDRDYIVTPA